MAATNAVDPSRASNSTGDFRHAAIVGGITFSAAAAVVKVSDAIGMGSLSEPVNALVIPGVTFVSTRFMRRGATGLRLLPVGIVPMAHFEIGWAATAVIGALLILGTANLGSFIGVLLTGTVEGALSGSVFCALVGAYAVGRWIGIRADRHPFVAAAIAPLLARGLGALLDLLVVPAELKNVLGIAVTLEYFAAAFVGGILWAAASVFGSWMGRRAKEGAYAAYLLHRLPAATRSTAITLLFEEAERLAGSPIAR